MRIQEGLIVQNKERTTNPYSILEMDEKEEPDDEEMEDKIHEMQVVSPQRSPRRPAEKRTERDDASVGSMRHPSTRGKHETEGSKRNQEGVREEEMQAPEGRREDNSAEEGTLEGEDEELGGKDEFMYASTPKNGMTGKDIRETEKAEVMREVEDDKLSVLGEEYEDEGRENQREEVKEEQLLVSEEEEWDDTELEREAQEIEENSKKEAAKTVEGEDTSAKTKRGDKLAVKANQASAETDRKAIEDTKRELMRNPYFKSAKEKVDRREKE
jgi:hypothetical protein